MNTSSFTEVLLSHSVLLTMWAALILHWLFPLYGSHYHPLTLWQHVAEVISEKANRKTYSQSQQKLSGTLALLIMWLPLAALLITVKQLLTDNVWLFDLILLWLALGFKPVFELSIALTKFLSRAQKPASRILLSKIVKRDTSSLNQVALIKLSCETLSAGYVRTLINVLFFYWILGGAGAFLYSLLMQLHRIWSPKLPSYRYFSANLSKLVGLIEWIPTRLFALFLSLGIGFFNTFDEIKASFSYNNLEFIWSIVGSKYQIALGGSALYEDEKVERKLCGGQALAQAKDLTKINQHLLVSAFSWILLQTVIMSLL